jgi:hypothetical protein
MAVLVIVGSSSASDRMVLGEMFTNWGCSPCKPANDELDRFAPLHPNLAVIRYHTWWPNGADPFYLDNTSENTVRTNYYQPGSKYVPRFFVDGIIDGESNYSSWETMVTGRESAQSPLTIDLDGTYNSGTRSGTVVAYIEATDVISLTNLKLHFVLTESDINLSAPNGQTIFHEVMRDMLPGSSGELVSLSSPGDTLMRERDFSLDSSWVLQNCEIVVFIQSDQTKEVLQAAKWQVPVDVPNLSYVENTVVDSAGNSDGRADPGESVDMIVTLANDPIFQDATSVVATLTCGDVDVSITHGTANYPDIPADSVRDNSADPFKFSVSALAVPHRADFDLEVTAEPGGYTMSHGFSIMLGRPDVLLVDDDGGNVYEMFFRQALDSLQVVFDDWDIHSELSTPPIDLYHCVIWFTGDDSVNTLTGQDILDLESFLDSGGGLILTGQNIGQEISADPFYTNYLHSNLVGTATSDHILEGEPGDPVGDGLSLITAGGGGAGNQFSQDVIEPAGGASAVFKYSEDSVAAVRFDSGTYRVIYYAFGLEGLNKISLYSGRDTVLARSLNWIGCPVPVGLEEEYSERIARGGRIKLEASPNPFRDAIRIDADISVAGGFSISVFDMAGRLVKRLAQGNGFDGSSPVEVMWDGSDGLRRCQSGVYFVRLRAGEFSEAVKVILVE